MKKTHKLTLTLTVLSYLLFIISCSKQDKSSAEPDLQTVTRQTLAKVSFNDNSFTVPVEVVSVLAVNIDKLMPGAKNVENSGELSVEKSFTINDSAGSPNMYIFNYKDDGYAVFSADERYTPLLAIVKKGKFEKREVSAGLLNWFDMTMDYINLAKVGKIDSKGKTEAAWKHALAIIESSIPVSSDGEVVNRPQPTLCCEGCPNYPDCLAIPELGCGGDPNVVCNPCGTATYTQKGPYLQTQWGQRVGYNDLCPNYNCTAYTACSVSNTNVPTGCVATAVAQIMRYWAVPTPYNYNYTGMPDIYNACNGNNTEIHRLIRNIADAVGMGWECSGSGADPEDAANVLRTIFGYSSATYSSYDSGDHNIIVTNLNAGRPVILGGYKTRTFIWPFYGYENGHAWVCDGYYRDSNNCYSYLYFNMNWGWDSSDDGWFAYNNWAPPTAGNLQYKQDIIYNIYP